MSKKISRKKVIKIIDDRWTNWEQKSILLQEVFKSEKDAEESFIDIIKNHQKSSLRKGAASVIAYFEHADYTSELVKQLFIEKEWTVRYSLARSCAKHLQGKILEKIRLEYNESIIDKDLTERHKRKMIFAEVIGAINRKEGLSILLAMLDELGNNTDQFSSELKIQLLYSIGEIGDKGVVNKLLKYSAENPSTTKAIRDSASHALSKIAKHLGFSSKAKMLEEINKE